MQMQSPLALLEHRRSNPLASWLNLTSSAAVVDERLRRPPWNRAELKHLSADERIQLANELSSKVALTKDLLSIHLNMQRMVGDGLALRHPEGTYYAGRIFDLAHLQQEGASLEAIPLLPWRVDFFGGMHIMGESGTGKSLASETVYTQWPQVYVHQGGVGELAYLKQLGWLKVHMPADGTRGGFLLNAFMSVDRALGSDYADRYVRLTVERQLVKLLYVLALHRCGVLIIEEAQETNLHNTPYGKEFLNFFLRLLNWSIPVVLIGNPLAFGAMYKHAQLLSRFSAYGGVRMSPLASDDPEWEHTWMPTIWKPSILTEEDAPISRLNLKIWRATGGFPRYLQRLRIDAEICALRNGSERLEQEHIAMALQGPTMVEVRGLIKGFAMRSVEQISVYSDIDVPYYASLWGKARNEPSQKRGKLSESSEAGTSDEALAMVARAHLEATQRASGH